jgi:hypothetical protein
MKATAYKQAMDKLNLSEAQSQLLGQCFGQFLLESHTAYQEYDQRARKRGEPLPPVAYRHLGKIEGLKLAMQIVLGTLTIADGLEPETFRVEHGANGVSDSPLAVGDVEDLVNKIVALLAPGDKPNAQTADDARSKQYQGCVRPGVGALMPSEILGGTVEYPEGTEGALSYQPNEAIMMMARKESKL